MPKISAQQVIDRLGLSPLPGEGGYFCQTYIVEGTEDEAAFAPETTAILYLMTPTSWSGLHRLAGDEMFHFYLGDPCRMATCSPEGVVQTTMLGHDLAAGHEVQALVPGGSWQGTMLVEGGSHGFALLGTTMTPGYRQDQFELASEHDLDRFPDETSRELRAFLAPEQSS